MPLVVSKVNAVEPVTESVPVDERVPNVPTPAVREEAVSVP